MTLGHAGLILNAVGSLLLGFESWIKTRGISADSMQVGHGEIGGFWIVAFRLAWPMLVIGFVLQYLAEP